jgi:zinc protease
METTAQLAGRLAELVLFRLPDDYHHHFRERIRAVTLESARAAVRAHLHPERAGVVVVGDAERILPEVEALELGPVEVLDA